MSLKLFKFSVENTRTGESTAFLGQGETLDEAWKEGTQNVMATWRPSSSGAKRPEHGLGVILPTGDTVFRTLRNFEGDLPYDKHTEKKS